MNIFEKINTFEYNLSLARIPITVMHTIVLIVTLIIQVDSHKVNWWQIIIVIFLFSFFNFVHWYSDWFLSKLKSGYFVLLGLIILCLVLIIPKSTIIILLGLMPIFMIQGIVYFEEKWRSIALVIGYYTFSSTMIYINFAFEDLLIFMILFTFMLALLTIIIMIFNQQQAETQKLQFYVDELESANEKIEQLTLKNERNRMARDLHDTLAQRLVGLVLKLEASESHLEQGNIEKSKEIIKNSIEQAKQTVREARHVIDDLREQESMRSLVERIHEEIEQLQMYTEAKISIQTNRLTEVPTTFEEHIISIIREVVHNAQKHSNATKIDISLNLVHDQLILQIWDNGIGIDMNSKFKQGHYGILGIEERVRLMQGTLEIENDNGTKIKVVIPMK